MQYEIGETKKQSKNDVKSSVKLAFPLQLLYDNKKHFKDVTY